MSFSVYICIVIVLFSNKNTRVMKLQLFTRSSPHLRLPHVKVVGPHANCSVCKDFRPNSFRNIFRGNAFYF
jgi:hypothetical protein